MSAMSDLHNDMESAQALMGEDTNMTKDQTTELLIVLNHINETLAEVASSLSIIASEGLSQSDKVALAILNGMLADGDYNDIERLVEASREVANDFMLGSDG